MLAVIFEVYPNAEGKDEYLEIAAGLRDFLQDRDGFISIERFQSLVFWRDEEAIKQWRNLLEHRSAQQKGKTSLFHSYRIRVAEVVRDYSATERNEAPADSNAVLS